MKHKLKVLLLGSSGAFGTAVEAACRNKAVECVSMDHGQIEVTEKGELDAAVERHRPDAVINSVAIPRIDLCEIRPEKAFNVNAAAVSNMAGICSGRDIILAQISTNTIFDGKKKKGFYTERSKPNPINVYAASKYAGECLVMNNCKKFYIARLPTLFGKRRNKNAGIVDRILNWMDEKKDIRIADDRVDSFGYTDDLAELLIEMLREGKPFGIYHLANSGKASYYDFVSEIMKILKPKVRLLRAKHGDFEGWSCKPLRTPAKSVKLKSIRSWKQALRAYLEEIKT